MNRAALVVVLASCGSPSAPATMPPPKQPEVVPPEPATKPTLDRATRDRVLDAIVAKLDELYVYPDVAKKMEIDLREKQRAAAYDAAEDPQTFATMLTEQLRAVSRDKHVMIMWSPEGFPAADAEPTAEEKAREAKLYEEINCFLEKVETLDGSIGYIKLNGFAPDELCGAKVTAAFATLGAVKSVIFDLRENGGGYPTMVAHVSSYLFAKRTHLNDLYDRKENKTTEYWTKPEVPGPKLATQPIYVLTSSKTFSAAEEFSYNLKNLKRATIIGETTAGGAHPTTREPLVANFAIGVPYARAINPISKTNWEGTGVAPDIAVPAAEALDKAKALAAKASKK